VQRHNAVVPLAVISLDTGKEYTPGAEPDLKRSDLMATGEVEVVVLVTHAGQGVVSSSVRQGELETVLILLDELSQTAPDGM